MQGRAHHSAAPAAACELDSYLRSQPSSPGPGPAGLAVARTRSGSILEALPHLRLSQQRGRSGGSPGPAGQPRAMRDLGAGQVVGWGGEAGESVALLSPRGFKGPRALRKVTYSPA
jgi:hypothetical protein